MTILLDQLKNFKIQEKILKNGLENGGEQMLQIMN